jgi:hypothetical protein
VEANLHLVPDIAPVLLRAVKRPLDARRADLDDVGPPNQILVFQVARQLTVPVRALLEGHGRAAVDEDPQHHPAGLGGDLQVPEIERLLLQERPEPARELLA